MIRIIPLLMFFGFASFAFARCDNSGTDVQPVAPVHEIATVSLSPLVEEGRKSQLGAFDISPDGSLLAMLYLTWNAPPALPRSERWLTIWAIDSRKPQRSIRLVSADAYQDITEERRRLVFTADGRHIAAIAQNKLFIIETETGTLRSYTPANSHGLPVELQSANNAVVAVSYKQRSRDGYYTELLDSSSFQAVAGWSLPTFPQSFSPDGKLASALAVKEWNQGGVSGLWIVDAATGSKLRSIAVGFGFKNRQPYEGGTVISRFLDNELLLATPDHMIDNTGHHSGYNLEIINTTQNKITEEIAPPHFVPAGDLVVSQDRSRFAVFSISASAQAFHSESSNAKDFKHEVFIYSRNGGWKLEGIIEDAYYGLPGTASAEAMRLSANGFRIALGGDSIRVFQIGK